METIKSFKITIKYWETFQLKSNITTTSLHFKITLIKDNIYDNKKEWLFKYTIPAC